jgi:hypothetical protein
MALGKQYGAGTFQLKIELDEKSYSRLMTALKVIGEEDAPHIRAALWRVGNRFTSEINSRAPRSFRKFNQRGVINARGGLRFVSAVAHPAARRHEFGRNPRPYGVSRRQALKNPSLRARAGYTYKGQSPRPYVGVISGNAASGAVAPYAREQLTQAVSDEWDRIGRGA